MIEGEKDKDYVLVKKEEYEQFLEEQRKKKKKEKTTVQIRISKTMKNDWEKYIEKTHMFKTLSELIRACANDYIFPDSNKRAFDEEKIPEDFDSHYKGYLSRIDNWKNYKRIRKIEQIIKDYNAMVAPEQRKEGVKAKLLDIQQYLLSIIFEISSLIPE